MLGRLAEDAALAYAHVETESLRSQVASLNLGLSRTALAPAGALGHLHIFARQIDSV